MLGLGQQEDPRDLLTSQSSPNSKSFKPHQVEGRVWAQDSELLQL